MDMTYGEFQQRLLATFKLEAHEHLNAIATGLMELEQAPAAARQGEIVEAIFRQVHSLKGAAGAVNLTPIQTICQAVEGVFATLKRQEIAVSSQVLDVLHHAVGILSQLLAGTETPADEPQGARLTALIHNLATVVQADTPPLAPAQLPTTEAAGEPVASTLEGTTALLPDAFTLTETVRVPTARLTALLLQAEELLAVKWTVQQRAAKLHEARVTLAAWLREWTKLRPVVRQARRFSEGDSAHHRHGTVQPPLQPLLEFIDWSRDVLQALDAELTALGRASEHEQHAFSAMVEQLHEDTKKVLMLPFSALLEGFPPFVRALSRAQGKEVELVLHGEGVEIDRRILEGLKDPLVHLVRNCLDHGIEPPRERERKQKPRRGRITIAVTQQDARSVELRIADDGAGIVAATVKAAAVRLGLLAPAAAAHLSAHEVLPLVFQSGLSTSPIVTDISGRGLGLAIVCEQVEKLAGTISMVTQPEVGTTFSLVLPLTLTTFRGLLVRVHERLFVLPTTYAERVLRVPQDGIKSVENRATITLNGSAVALVRLAETLALPQHRPPMARAHVPVVILTMAERRIAFLVDEVLSEQEVLVKPLGRQLSRVRNIAGATVLATGKVVPILHVPDLMLSAVRTSAARARPPAPPAEASAAPRRTVLVAEDSITSRMLLKNILEAAGYEVETATDGVDALAKLRRRAFAAVISDVDMPRMNGFDLTASIRRDKQLADVPVVLVTALDSRADRERGIEVGANAYLVKSSFDQSNLLEVMRRLL
jgi:two-component system, chemotaxis family, sensor kinase CheA